jgi:hypothetical protein
LATVGVVAVDGTKMGADASSKANRTRAQIEAEVAKMFTEAAAADGQADRLFGEDRGDELPADLVDPRRRAARLDAALKSLEAQEATRRRTEAAGREARQALVAQAASRGERPNGRIPIGPDGIVEAQARLDESLAADTARLAAWEQRRQQADAGERSTSKIGRRPGPSTQTKRARRTVAKALEQAARAARRDNDAQRMNVTDPDSRVMKTPHGFVQGYNAQAAVNRDGVVIAAAVTNEASDSGQCTPMMTATRASLDAAGVTEPIGTMLFDAGYCSTDNLTAPGPDRLIATAKTYKLRRVARQQGWAHGDPPPDADPIRAMEHRLRTQAGAELYGLRQHTVEPVFGNIKDGRGFRRFMRRGLSAANAEWQLITASHNILKLHRSSLACT